MLQGFFAPLVNNYAKYTPTEPGLVIAIKYLYKFIYYIALLHRNRLARAVPALFNCFPFPFCLRLRAARTQESKQGIAIAVLKKEMIIFDLVLVLFNRVEPSLLFLTVQEQ